MKSIQNLFLATVAAMLATVNTAAQEVCLTTQQYAAITYDWNDPDTGESGTDVPLTQRATNPYQIYELLRTIYCDPRVPGALYTAYDQNGARENLVHYGDNVGGWNIIADEPTAAQLAEGYKQVIAPSADNEGYTVVMCGLNNNVQVYDGVNPSRFSSKAQLINYIRTNIASVELLTDGLRLGQGQERGTVFNISGTYNKFFYLSKGRSRVNTIGYEVPFEDMFEQFSPTDGSEQLGSDYYQRLMNGEMYDVQHDCSSVIENRHYFTMSGENGTTYYNCDGLNFFIPDYRLIYNGTKNVSYYGTVDMRDAVYQRTFYGKYSMYQTHMPSSMLYNIRLKAERSEDVDENNMYTITLTWDSNLDEINGAPFDNQIYHVYCYGTDSETGARIRIELEEHDNYTQPTSVGKWVYKVPKELSSYSLTYVVAGWPIDPENEENHYKFTHTDSNDATVIIPGTDLLEALELKIDGHYESVYNVNQEVNEYRNTITMDQGLGTTKITANHLNGRAQNNYTGHTYFTLYRYPNGMEYDDEGNPINQNGIQVATLDIAKTYHRNNWGANYYSFSWTITYNGTTPSGTTNSGSLDNVNANATSNPLDLNGIQFIDAFTASTVDNTHPLKYDYRVYSTALVGDGTDEDAAHSNVITVPVKKTELSIAGTGYTEDQVYNGDDDHSLTTNTSFVNMEVKAYDDAVLRYEVDRGTDGGKPVLDAPLIGAQRLSSGTGYQPLVRHGNELVAQGDEHYYFNGATSVQVPLSDEAPMEGITTYVPVVRTYRPDGTLEEYNTYGAPIQTFALGKIESIEALNSKDGNKAEISDYTWTENGVEYCYYNVRLQVNGMIPSGYEPVGFRAWRTCALAHESSVLTDPSSDLYVARIKQRQDDALDANKGYLIEKDFDGDYGEYASQPVAVLGDVMLENPELVTFGDEWTGTFGAPMISHTASNGQSLVGSITELPVSFRVRMYYKKRSAGGHGMPRRAPGDEEQDSYYVVEKDYNLSINADNIITSVSNLKLDRQVQSVTYVNTMGIPSQQPWSGVNIVVTRYTDGTTSTVKVVK